MGVEPMSALLWPLSTTCLVDKITILPLYRHNNGKKAGLVISLRLQNQKHYSEDPIWLIRVSAADRHALLTRTSD